METNIFEKYKEELENDIKLDDLNIKDIQLNLPRIKHKWVARLINAKIDYNKLKRARKEAIDILRKQASEEGIVSVSEKTFLMHIENHDSISKIDRKINECEFLIEYLEKIEKINASITYDIKNLIELKRMELT